ncbi:MAG: hypothetical protein COA96_01760 [SAR86 cluster bacterium]|uniref:HemY N-terminal domain-containing protein n=1 Tax=SAR86 cluster bacterium TaxID=2030880 RepID=A0A2A5B9L6_9GAMM|nr:MAG: hypothetical protein COA96_01760 [SAR86 cluster bacterium]
MIKLYIFSLLAIVLALLVSLVLGFPADPGYLLVSFGNYTFETSLFALIVAVAVIYVIVKLLLFVFHWINPWQLIRSGRKYNRQRKAKARSKTVEGLLYFTRGNWESSYNLLIKSTNDPDASVVNYLAAAYAAYQRDDKNAWVQCLEKAEQEYPAARSTINSLKAQLLFKSDQLEQCVAVLQQLKTNSLNDSSLLKLLKEVYLKLEDWKQLEKLLPTLEKNKIIESNELERIRIRVFMEKLYAASDITGRVDAAEAQNQLSKLWKKAPASYKQDQRVVKHYSEILFKLGNKEEAAKIIETALGKHWSDALVIRYGELDFGGSQKQLLQAENWLKARPGNAELLLTLGRLSLRTQLWGKACEYFQTSIKIAPSVDAYGELGRLLKHLGKLEEAEENQEKFIALLGAELPELPLPSKPGSNL